jgi:hypothetical protein
MMPPDYEKSLKENGYSGVKWDAESALLGCVDMSLVRQAINENNRELAMKNFEGVKEFIRRYVPNMNNTTLQPTNILAFEHFATMIHEKGIEYWFPEDPMTHWCNIGAPNNAEPESKFRKDGNHNGIESFLFRVGAMMGTAGAQEEYGKQVVGNVQI